MGWLRRDITEAAVAIIATLAAGLPLLWFVNWAPAAWLAPFNILGAALRPWLAGGAALAIFIPAYMVTAKILDRVCGLKSARDARP